MKTITGNDSRKSNQEENERLTEQVKLIRDKYGKAYNFFEVFKPELQDKTSKNEDRVYFGQSPTLELVALAYSEQILISWLVDQYEYFNSQCAVQQLDVNQLEELALLTFLNANNLKVSEIQLFIFKVRSSVYGEFFGKVDIQRILFFLQEFKNERRKKLADFYYEQKEEEKKKIREQWRKESITRQQYEEMVKSGTYKPRFMNNSQLKKTK